MLARFLRVGVAEVRVRGVTLRAEPESSHKFDPFLESGSVVWQSSHTLCQFLDTGPLQSILPGARVLELGAGLGMVGLAAGVLGASSVCFTDRLIPRLPEIDFWTGDIQACAWSDDIGDRKGSDRQLTRLRNNIHANMSRISSVCSALPTVSVSELEFGDRLQLRRVLQEHGPFDVILGSDITYMAQVVPALVSTLQLACSYNTEGGSSAPHVILAHDRRAKFQEEVLRDEFTRGGFHMESIQEECNVIIFSARYFFDGRFASEFRRSGTFWGGPF